MGSFLKIHLKKKESLYCRIDIRDSKMKNHEKDVQVIFEQYIMALRLNSWSALFLWNKVVFKDIIIQYEKHGGYMEDKINNSIEPMEDELLERLSDELYRNHDSVEVITKGDGYSILTEKRIGKKYKVTDKYPNDFLQDNEKIKVFEDRGFKFGDYIEVFIEYSAFWEDPTVFQMREFSVDSVIVRVEKPSFLFDLVFDGFDKNYESNEFFTISLKGITEENYEEYLTKAIFLIGYYNPPLEIEDYPYSQEYVREYDWNYAPDEENIKSRQDTDAFVAMSFNNLRYPEALAFYNEGKKLLGHEMSFQYFYKVIEHFFLVCRREEFETLINEYNTNSNIDHFIDKVTSIYKQNEDLQLKELLCYIETDILDIIESCYSGGYIDDKTVESFSQAFYKYRNTIVHGKSDDRFSVKTPSILGNINEVFWSNVAEKIAEILIKKYCL